MIGTGGDQQSRQDMFPTQIQDWQTQDRVGSPPIGKGSSFDIADHPIQRELVRLGALRDAHPALSTGATIVRYASGRILAVSRIDAAAKREYIAAFNSGTTTTAVTVTTSTPNATWSPLLRGLTVTSTSNGSMTFDVPALSGVLLRAGSDLAVATPRPAIRVTGDDLSNMWRVAATVAGGSPVSVGFGVRRAKGKWTRLAADDTPPYRAFVDPAKYRKNEKLELVAVVRGLNGSTATSKVVTFRVRAR
jgi:hypothetical protein